jgi:hypothetical protein
VTRRCSFIGKTPARSSVEFEHRNLDNHGDGWEGVGEGVDGDQGRPHYLQRYAALFSERS